MILKGKKLIVLFYVQKNSLKINVFLAQPLPFLLYSEVLVNCFIFQVYYAFM